MTVLANRWIEQLRLHGYDFAAQVPCSILDPLLDGLEREPSIDVVTASSEGEAVALAVGAWLAGRKPMVLCQNSGLGNAVNPLSSLVWPAAVPLLLFVSWRGEPGRVDEPQHELMGRITLPLLELLDVPTEPLPHAADEVAASLERAEAVLARQQPFAFAVRRGAVIHEPGGRRVRRAPPRRPRTSTPDDAPPFGSPELSRRDVIALCQAHMQDRVLLGSTGKIGRELYELGDGERCFYNVGAMGCVAGIGLGIALGAPHEKVCVLDGDGSLLMKLGTLATVGHTSPSNFIHVLLDNEQHESAGGQPTASATVDFATVARGAGYRQAWSASRRADVVELLRRATILDGPTLLHVKVAVETSPTLARPELGPRHVAARLRRFLTARPEATS